MLAGDFPVIGPPEFVEQLDAEDRLARLQARRGGHRHPLAVGAAMRKCGRQIGVVKM